MEHIHVYLEVALFLDVNTQIDYAVAISIRFFAIKIQTLTIEHVRSPA
jgi:hypothetical protein